MRFEKIAEIHQWKTKDYHTYLGSSLRGRALKEYSSLPDETVKDYDALKEAFLDAYTIRCRYIPVEV